MSSRRVADRNGTARGTSFSNRSGAIILTQRSVQAGASAFLSRHRLQPLQHAFFFYVSMTMIGWQERIGAPRVMDAGWKGQRDEMLARLAPANKTDVHGRQEVLRDCKNLNIVFSQAPAKPLLLGEMVGIVQCGEIGDSFLGFLAAVGVDDLKAIARRQGIEKVHHPAPMVLT
jgi:hypothetical protein